MHTPIRSTVILVTVSTSALVIGLIVTIYVGALGQQQITQTELAQQHTEQQLAMIQSHVDDLKEIAAALLAENATVAQKLEEEKARRLAAEKQQATAVAAANRKFAQLQQEVAGAKQPDITSIISVWRPRVAAVRCRTEMPTGVTYEDAGSGTLLLSSPYPTVITNRHVVTHLGYTAKHCLVKFPDDTIATISTADEIDPSPSGADWARIYLKNPTPYVRSLASGASNRCATKAQIGANILIMGYPSIGALDDVTVTEGIISGYEGDFYISSAKVERGNSGGAAIDTARNCYLGMPTYVGAGQLETLARILDQKIIFP